MHIYNTSIHLAKIQADNSIHKEIIFAQVFVEDKLSQIIAAKVLIEKS